MAEPARRLRREDIAHLLRAAAGVTQERRFVIVGTGAVIARLRHVPLALMQTREIDIYAPEAEDAESVSTLIDGTIGEGSPFDATFGYYAHGVGALTACMPSDWAARAATIAFVDMPGVILVCPEPNDIALSKLCAWREKDQEWLRQAIGFGAIGLGLMAARAGSIDNPNAPPMDEVRRRLAWLAAAPKG